MKNQILATLLLASLSIAAFALTSDPRRFAENDAEHQFEHFTEKGSEQLQQHFVEGCSEPRQQKPLDNGERLLERFAEDGAECADNQLG
nr:hypothetical protein [uncultured Pseudomonas sp.]